ncbi:MAG: hypothetical protein ACQETE_13495 [Bacteroidota bacterium]
MKLRSNLSRFTVLLIFALIFTSLNAFAQQGKYVRKSVSSVESVWVKPGAIDFDVPFNYSFFDKMTEEYIEMSRFDYNSLPDTLLYEFRKQANQLETVNPETIKGVLEETVVQEILNILNDPEVKQARGQNLKSEADLESFAATKAKSLALTGEELKTLMNSAYIYLPYVDIVTDDVSKANVNAMMSQMVQGAMGTDDDDLIQVQIKGGIVWYKLNVAPDGTTDLDLIKNTETEAIGSADETENKKFRYGEETFNTSPLEYAFFDATQAWAKNLGVQTKEIKDFKLSAQIVEVVNDMYSLPIGRKEGIHMDDTFFLVENVQTSDGEVKEKRVGFVRVTDLGDNNEDPNDYSKAMHLLGDKQQPGVVVRENPRYGMNLNFGFSGISGMSVMPDDALGTITEEATGGYGVGVNFAYNLAPITGSSQLFLELDLGFHGLNAESNPDSDYSPFLLNAGLNITKKFWFGRGYAGLGGGLGYDGLSISGTNSLGISESLTFNTISLGGDAEVGFLLAPNWTLHAGIGYKYATSPFSVSYKRDGESIDYPLGTDAYEDLSLGGLTYKVGLTYAIRNLPFNVFGFLDGMKKY